MSSVVSVSGSQSSPKNLKCKDLFSYLKTLSPAILDRLYCHPATCLAVFRQLPELAQHYVVRLLFVEQPVPQVVVSSWVKQEIKKHLQSAEVLNVLHIWSESPMPGGLPGWILNSTFRKNLRIALLGGGQAWAVCAPLEKDKHGRDIQFLDTYAMERWECVLHYMVGSQQVHEGGSISADAVRILLHAGLMKSDDKDSSPAITMEGFQFLLMDTCSQVWYFMLQYLDTVEDYSSEGMSESLLMFLQHLREFGLVYQRKRRSGRFYPTRLALNLASGLKGIEINTKQEGYIVVETNFRVYAYTDSPLQIALLSLFCEMIYRFPNLVVGVITRESVRQALKSGITADQIINFLRMNSHPEAKKQSIRVPPTIMDQIRLWEMERDRFNFKEGVLYSQFLSQSDFEMLRDYARDLGVLVWDNPSKRVMVVSRGGHDEVKRFWKQHKH